MWLLTTCVAALFFTGLWLFAPRKYRLDILCLMLWGATVMIFVDHVLGDEGGEFFEMTTDGMISNGIVLGIVMLIPIFLVWEIYLAVLKLRGKL